MSLSRLTLPSTNMTLIGSTKEIVKSYGFNRGGYKYIYRVFTDLKGKFIEHELLSDTFGYEDVDNPEIKEKIADMQEMIKEAKI
jgi:hypothetical protein